MTDNEKFLKEHICSNCHAAILQDHPEEKFKLLNFKKCPICGFTKEFKVVVNPLHRIIYGKSE